MKNLILALSFILTFTSAFAQSKVGTIDADYILAQMPEMEQVNQNLQEYSNTLKAEAEKSFTEYQNLIKNYQDSTAIYTPVQKEKREQNILALENKISGFQQKATLMIQMKRNELTQPLYQKINGAMLEVIAEEGFTQILHSGGAALAYSAEEFDITLKVLDKMGIEVEEAPAPQE